MVRYLLLTIVIFSNFKLKIYMNFAVWTEISVDFSVRHIFIQIKENEEVLNNLNELLEMTSQSIIDDYSSIYYLDIDNPVSEKTANEMMRINHSERGGNMKLTGKLSLPDELEPTSECLNHVFYNGRLRKYIKK